MEFVRSIWFLLTPQQKRSSVWLLGWMTLSMLFEMLGIGLLLPALTAMSGAPDAGSSRLAKQTMEFLGNPSPKRLVIWGLLALVVIYVLKAVVVLIATWRQTKFVRRLEKSICERLFNAYMTQPWEFHLQRNTAELIRNMSNVGMFADAAALLLNIIAEVFILVGISVMLLIIDPVASVIVGLLAAASAFVLDRLTKNRMRRWGATKQEHQALALRAIQEGLGGIKDAKVLGRENYFLENYARHAGVLAAMAERYSVVSVVPRLWNELLGVTSLCVLALILLWQGMPLSALVPTLGVFGAAAFRMLPSVNRVSMAAQNLRYTSELAQTIAAEFQAQKVAPASVACRPMVLGKSIELVDVSFRYSDKGPETLHRVTMSIPAGSAVGIIGSSGAGKSTLVDVILGLMRPSQGSVRVDGADISDNPGGWQQLVGYVPQAIYLSDNTIRANVAFGIPEAHIDDKAIAKAIRAAQLDEFVATLPDGVHTFVGERGVRLSGGQRQRIGIARALYHDPQVLVLDEATSALDTETEAGVMEAVNALHGAKTLIVVAHRLSTISNCDRIYRLERGRVAKVGTFAEVVEG
jgi:ABC-type multidrug transport system fused ATPase/permease subunit